MVTVLGQPPADPFAAWEQQGRDLAHDHTIALWRLGDWLVDGIDQHGQRHVHARMIVGGLDVKHLEQLAQVAIAFEPERRRHDLTWFHHAEVASHDPDIADALLQRAATEALTVAKVRQLAKGAAS